MLPALIHVGTLLLLTVFSMPSAIANHFPKDTPYEVCFTPQQNCTQQIVSRLEKANKEILVQAYSFTSYPILQAFANAQKKGVIVKVILDKSQNRPNHNRAANFLKNHGVPLW